MAEHVPLNYRSLWLSDVHLGTLSSRAEDLLDFIGAVNAERIYLVGDIIDLQRMKSRPRFPDLHLRVVAEFARLAARHARERGFNGIVCGHIHRPNLRRVDGCLYANDGDWVEHGTALAELADGTLQILRWQASSITIDYAQEAQWVAA